MGSVVGSAGWCASPGSISISGAPSDSQGEVQDILVQRRRYKAAASCAPRPRPSQQPQAPITRAHRATTERAYSTLEAARNHAAMNDPG